MAVLHLCCWKFSHKKLCSRLHSIKVDFYSKKTIKSLFEPPFLDLGVMYALHLKLAEKPVVDFMFVVSELFHYLLQLRRYEWKLVEVSVFRTGWVTLSAYFRGKGALPTNHCWCQKTRMIAVLWGIKISAVHHLVLSQYMRLTDKWTDAWTEGQTELRQQYRALHYIQSHGKNHCHSQ